MGNFRISNLTKEKFVTDVVKANTNQDKSVVQQMLRVTNVVEKVIMLGSVKVKVSPDLVKDLVDQVLNQKE